MATNLAWATMDIDGW